MRRLSATAALSLLVLTACAKQRAPVAPSAPSGPEHQVLLEANAQRGAGAVEDSLAVYRRAVERDRAAVRPHLHYVRAMLAQGRGAELRRYYEGRGAAADATDAERTIAQRLRTNGASSALRAVYREAAGRNPQNPWWPLALAEVETMEADAWNRKRIDAVERGEGAAEEQARAQSRGAVRRAHRAVERAGRLDPGLAEAWLYRGFLRAVEGDLQPSEAGRTASFEAAADAFHTATRMDGDIVEAWSGLGEVNFELGELRESLVAYLEAVRRAPADGHLRVSLGVVLHEIGRLREAALQYEAAADLRPWDAEPLVRLGDALADAENWNKALDAYRRALARDANAIEGHYKMGSVLEYLNRPAEARAAYERYVAQGGDKADVARRRIERLLRAERR